MEFFRREFYVIVENLNKSFYKSICQDTEAQIQHAERFCVMPINVYMLKNMRISIKNASNKFLIIQK